MLRLAFNLKPRSENSERYKGRAPRLRNSTDDAPVRTTEEVQKAIIVFNKPMNVLCQFSGSDDKRTLADFIDAPGYYPAGRLDYDSEGLLLLTNQGWLQARIAEPRFKLPKTYLVQVEGDITDDALMQLTNGVELKDGLTRPAVARRIETPDLWPREPPVRFRKMIPTSWLSLCITEGRNRQVRRMTAAVGFPTLRLVRWQIGEQDLAGLAPGAWRTRPVPDELLPPAATSPRHRRGTPRHGS
ncbi:MAG: pseudouridine synthase [unclassified Hahellaceae]|nr:pseudouridine synthase [Hahellaceae bacterium]|tara:strand:+ start:76503 stop:77231 length:729 start_codon:yes stop_codon:yes gene_type:complete